MFSEYNMQIKSQYFNHVSTKVSVWSHFRRFSKSHKDKESSSSVLKRDKTKDVLILNYAVEQRRI